MPEWKLKKKLKMKNFPKDLEEEKRIFVCSKIPNQRSKSTKEN